jgi:hypothetical protein
VHRFPELAALVVVEVAGEVEDPIALEAKAAGLQHARARIVANAVRERGIARGEEDRLARRMLPPAREERALAEVDATELANLEYAVLRNRFILHE